MEKETINLIELHLWKNTLITLCAIWEILPIKKRLQQKTDEKCTLHQHLKYKFVISLEGNDVASNLKWIMSSNSIEIMPKPTYETWFIEGKFVAEHHYIEIKEDYSNLEQRLNYYIENPEKASIIIKNANEYVSRFFDEKREQLT